MVVHAAEGQVNLAPIEDQVAQFCGDCHAVPPAGSFPKRAWRDEVGLGFNRYDESRRNDLVVPAFESVVDYYVSRAPEELVLPEPEEAADPGPIRLLSRFSRRRPWWLLAGCLLAALLVYARFAMDQLGFSAPAIADPGSKADAFLTGRELYAKYGSACHGDDGDGRGVAARYLNPKARNLRSGSIRIVSTENRIPSLADVEAVLENGMPGTSMRFYRDLSEECRAKLVDEVFRLRRQGLREDVVRSLREEWPDMDPCDEDVDQLLGAQLTAGPTVLVPTFGASSPERISLGREIFLKSTCNQCHGDNATITQGSTVSGIQTRPGH